MHLRNLRKRLSLAKVRLLFNEMYRLSSCSFVLEPPLVIAIQELFADLYGAWRLYGYPVFVYGTTSEPGRVPPPISACFKHEVEFEVRTSRSSFSAAIRMISNC